MHPVLILRWLREAHPREKATDPIFSQKLIVFRRGEILPAVCVPGPKISKLSEASAGETAARTAVTAIFLIMMVSIQRLKLWRFS